MGTRPFIRRRMGRELAALRKASGLTVEQVARSADVNPSSVSRIEAAKMPARVVTIKSILDVYEPTPDQRAAVVELARQATADTWWHPYVGGALPKWFEFYVDLEQEADTLSIYDAQFVNGLAQTEEYARALFRASRPDATSERIDKLVQLRMDRQRRVVDGKVSLILILDELALRRRFGDHGIMRRQYEHLLELADIPGVSLAVLSVDAQPGVVGSFTVLDFPADEDPSVVYIEHEVGALYLEKSAQIRQYARAYGRLQTAALDLEASASRIAQLVKEL